MKTIQQENDYFFRIVGYLHNRTLLRNFFFFKDEFQKHAEQNKLDTKEDLLYNLIHMKSFDGSELSIAIKISISLYLVEEFDGEMTAERYKKASFPG